MLSPFFQQVSSAKELQTAESTVVLVASPLQIIMNDQIEQLNECAGELGISAVAFSNGSSLESVYKHIFSVEIYEAFPKLPKRIQNEHLQSLQKSDGPDCFGLRPVFAGGFFGVKVTPTRAQMNVVLYFDPSRCDAK